MKDAQDLEMTIGLFGTCGGSRWREPFKAVYLDRGISFFDPQTPHWSPELAVVEARHLREDGIILFAVTDETSGLGSLAETGFSMFQAMRHDLSRYFVFLVAATVDPTRVTDMAVRRESDRSRALVRAHLAGNPHPNVFLCDTLEAMLDVSFHLHRSLEALGRARAASLWSGA